MSAGAITRTRRACILLVDDDPGDQELTRRAFASLASKAELRIVADGEEALDYLYRLGIYADPGRSPRPDLILLDLNMPRMSGREVLARLRADEQFTRTPIVVLTTSGQDRDIARCYELGCNSYIRKPVEMEHFVDVVRQLQNYWFEVVTLPAWADASALQRDVSLTA